LYAQFAVQLSDLKKTLASPQNPENKRPGFLLPSRSMVLKVVRGKILETLGLGVVFFASGIDFGTARGAGKPHERHFLSSCCRVKRWAESLSSLERLFKLKNS
jgi:hypothetical protein